MNPVHLSLKMTDEKPDSDGTSHCLGRQWLAP